MRKHLNFDQNPPGATWTRTSRKHPDWFLVRLFLQQTIFSIVANLPQVGVNQKETLCTVIMREQNKDKIYKYRDE